MSLQSPLLRYVEFEGYPKYVCAFRFTFPTGLAISPTSSYKEISFRKENSFLILAHSERSPCD